MADSSSEDRTLAPSARRIEQAREQGNVPRSRELVSAAVLATTIALLWTLQEWIWWRFDGVMRTGLRFDFQATRDPLKMLDRLIEMTQQAGTVVLLFGITALLMVVGTTLLVGGLNFTTQAFFPNFSRLNPGPGLMRLVSVESWLEVGKGLLKALVLGWIGYWLMREQLPEYSALPMVEVAAASTRLWTLFRGDLLWLMLPMVVLASIDVPLVIWRWYERLKMTPEEMRQEAKETDGNPEIKGRIKAQQRAMARRRMMAAIPTADVVITNPTHYAVALRYKEGQDAAPVLLAKGSGELALKIREVAERHGVPRVEAPMLARALYKHVDLERSVPAALYTAVAQVLAYVYQLKNWRQFGGPVPVLPGALPVPQDMDIPLDERERPDLEGRV